MNIKPKGRVKKKTANYPHFVDKRFTPTPLIHIDRHQFIVTVLIGTVVIVTVVIETVVIVTVVIVTVVTVVIVTSLSKNNLTH